MDLTKCSLLCPKFSKCRYARKFESWLLYGRKPGTISQKEYEFQAFMINEIHVSDIELAEILRGGI